MNHLILEYKRSLREVRKGKLEKTKFEEDLERELAKPSCYDRQLKTAMILKSQDERRMMTEMENDIQFIIEWLENGRRPDSKRGADRKDVYVMDPAAIEVLPIQEGYKLIAKELPSFEKEIIEDALCTLTNRERDVFMMIKVEGLTFEYTAELIGVKKSTVQTHLERAERKIDKRKNESLFLVS
ncbi:sigma factor-like helix-turn-helix DNA-binding protein [Fictibacillus sp. JL2B1089]|uniref:sigma factor-like helix-turn-helix DNA-binding protein n=1 Tax=Fictibacillus sp. JL2B1089 TaxID=3399565 RepID=UPI003A8ABB8E